MQLRSRIRKHGGICCRLWKFWRGELPLLCVSAKVLFKKSGIDFHIVERELKAEGWLCENEDLMLILQSEEDLRRTLQSVRVENLDPEYGLYPSDWTEEDYLHNS